MSGETQTFERSVEGVADPDAVRLYFNQVGRVKLLTAEQEQALFRQIEAAREELRRVRSSQRATRGSREVYAAAERLQVLKDQVIQANLRLVVAVAKRYHFSRVPLLDRIQDGNLGLMDAVERFDYTRGFKFSTYAVWWIRRAIHRGMAANERIIRLPGHARTSLNRVLAAQTLLRRDLGRDPTTTELAAQAHLDPDTVRALLAAGLPPVELDAHVSDGTPLGAFLADDRAPSPDAPLDEADDHGVFLRLMATLNERERLVLKCRFGLDDTPPETLEEVGRRLHLSRERVRQIEKRAIERLRKMSAEVL